MVNKSTLRGIINRFLHIIARFSPGGRSIRPYLHKLRGVKIYGKVFIGEDVYLENEYPESIEIHNGVGIGLRSTIIPHFRGPGKIIIEEDVWIGTSCTVAASSNQVLKIGKGAVLAANCAVTKDILPYTLVGGVPAKPIAKVTVPPTLNTSYADFKKGLKPLK